MRKRLMASGLVVIMALGLMTGCNGKSSEAEKNTQSTKDSGNDNAQVSEESEERTIQYYYDFGEINQRTWVDDVKTLQIQDDTLLILTDKTYDNKAVKKLSESIKDSGNDFDIIMIKIPWEYTLNDTMADFIQYIQKNGINPDILCSVYGRVTNNLPKEMLYDMTDYLSAGKGKQLKAAMDDTYWILTEEDGHWYGVGSVVETCQGWLVDRETMIDLGLTVEDLKKPLSELEPVFEKVKAEKPELTPFIYGWGILESNTPVIMYDKNTYTGYWAGDDEKNIKNIFDDNRTYELVGTLNTFSEKGYAKLVDDTENRDDYFMKAAWDATPLMRTDSLDVWSSPTGRELVRIPYDDAAGDVLIQSSVIPSESDHIDQALEFLNQVDTTKEMSELLLYGIKDTDYTSDGNTYQTDKKWSELDLYRIPLGNLSVCMIMEPYVDTEIKTTRSDIDKLREKMQADDFAFDSSVVESQYKAVSEIISYVNNLDSLLDFNNNKAEDCADWKEYYEVFNNKLHEAGIDAVVEEMNQQIN